VTTFITTERKVYVKQICVCYSVSSRPNEELVHVYYAALNFRDVMTATGKLSLDVVTSSRLDQVGRCPSLNLREWLQHVIVR
jgi:predicted alternative tryptophan synthase beta-subunit